jgi:hypothetical protein
MFCFSSYIFHLAFLVWPVVPKVPQAYSRCGAAMVCTWSSSNQKKKIIFLGWMWLDHPSCLIRLVSNTEQEPCVWNVSMVWKKTFWRIILIRLVSNTEQEQFAWNVSMVWKRAFWRIILWWVQLDNCNVVHIHLEKNSFNIVARSKNYMKKKFKKDLWSLWIEI